MSLVDDETKVVATDDIEDAMNKPVEDDVVEDSVQEEQSVAEEKEPDIIDINLTTPTEEKKRFRLNGDNTKVLELNINDMGIVGRLSGVYKNLKKLDAKVNAINLDLAEDATDDDVDNFVDNIAKQLSDLDDEMREQIDTLFNSNVSEIVAPKGTACMYDPVGGMFRYEHIIETLSNLYANNLSQEFEKMRQRVDKHTSKYTKKKRH